MNASSSSWSPAWTAKRRRRGTVTACTVYGTVAGAVEVTGTAVILWEEKIRNSTPDTLILDGQSRSIVRNPARDELKPSRSPKKQEKAPKGKELER